MEHTVLGLRKRLETLFFAQKANIILFDNIDDCVKLTAPRKT